MKLACWHDKAEPAVDTPGTGTAFSRPRAWPLNRRSGVYAAAVGLASAALLGVLWLATNRPTPPPKVVVLGVDGLDIRSLDALVEAGDLPRFQSLYERGAVGTIRNAEVGIPPLSPRIWSTIATGVLPAEHGITFFVAPDGDGLRLLSSADRRAAAIWEIASLAGKRVGVVNWWFTYPAEPVNGFVVSDRYIDSWARRSADFYGGLYDREISKAVFPPELIETLGRTGLAGIEIDVDGANPEEAEVFDDTVIRLAFAAVEAHPVDLLMIYTRALDSLSHKHWHTHERRPGEPHVADLIADYLRRYDTMLGRLLDRLGEADHLLVLSDHGFARTRAAPSGDRTTGTHATETEANASVLIAVGPKIRSGVRLAPVSPLDIVPTVLHLLGVAPSTDLPGRVSEEALREGREPLLVRVPPYGRLPADAEGPTTTSRDQETIERLRMLGYLD